jgi:hypothetical protein
MLIDNITQNLPAFIGFIIAGTWLIYTSLQVAYKINLIKIVNKWLDKKRVILPSLLTLTLPFIFTYLSQEIPQLIES